jgi:hypothetical protein
MAVALDSEGNADHADKKKKVYFFGETQAQQEGDEQGVKNDAGQQHRKTQETAAPIGAGKGKDIVKEETSGKQTGCHQNAGADRLRPQGIAGVQGQPDAHENIKGQGQQQQLEKKKIQRIGAAVVIAQDRQPDKQGEQHGQQQQDAMCQELRLPVAVLGAGLVVQAPGAIIAYQYKKADQ